MFRQNVGGLDRVLRLTLGGILLFAGLVLLTGMAKLGVTLVVVGLLALVSGIVRFCGLYIPFGISTARPEGPPFKQVCDCAAWMKEKQVDSNAATLLESAKEGDSEILIATRSR
jgi:hypothetical protein